MSTVFLKVFNARGATVLDQDSQHPAVGLDRQVGAPPRGFQIRHRGARSQAVAGVDLIQPATVLHPGVEIGVIGQPCLLAGL
ncbi:hypothetical protein D3C75_938640 [compost metagenome]